VPGLSELDELSELDDLSGLLPDLSLPLERSGLLELPERLPLLPLIPESGDELGSFLLLDEEFLSFLFRSFGIHPPAPSGLLLKRLHIARSNASAIRLKKQHLRHFSQLNIAVASRLAMVRSVHFAFVRRKRHCCCLYRLTMARKLA
jgi:hypothetical protein